MKLYDEPSSVDVRGLVLSVEYEQHLGAPEIDRWSATIRHPALGAIISRAPTPAKAREKAKTRVHEQLEDLMIGHAQRHAHEIQ